ncbi:MAG: DUF2948 family protein [Neomegalonema sp.]|nr:DUF2948 family protein [Neomegalonema sp.]
MAEKPTEAAEPSVDRSADQTEAGDRATKPAAEPDAPVKDAAFEDAFRPTRLMAQDSDDLEVFSALLQDAVVLVKESAWLRAERRFAFVANRYRWEEPAMRERVRTGVHFDNVTAVQARGIDLTATDAPLVVLGVSFEANAQPPSGVVRIACAGGGDVRISVEALEAAMADISKPWKARRAPRHIGGAAR